MAEALGISPSTVKRDWNLARAWLRNELSKSGEMEVSPNAAGLQ
jgi:DNA-directed RNA polymerase specialized sigma24 family protein